MRHSETCVLDVHGTVANGFEEVRDEFTRNFQRRGELGAACACITRVSSSWTFGEGTGTSKINCPGKKIHSSVCSRPAKGWLR